MRKNIIVGILLLTFVVTMVSAFAMDGMCEMGKKNHKRERGAKTQAKTDEIRSKLNLTAEQATKIKDIRMKAKEDTKAILEEAKAKIKQIRVSANEQIKALLTEEQKAKFKELRKKSEQEPTLKEE